MAFVHDHSDNFGPRRRAKKAERKHKTNAQYLREAAQATQQPEFDRIIWEAERQLATKLDAASYQRAVQSAKLWLILRPDSWLCFSHSICRPDTTIQAQMVKVDWLKEQEAIEPLEEALVFLLRAYRLQKGLS